MGLKVMIMNATDAASSLSHDLYAAWDRLIPQDSEKKFAVTARQLTDALNKVTGRDYPIQTVLTVLKRWETRRQIAKVPMIAEDEQLVWGYIQLAEVELPSNVDKVLAKDVLEAWLNPFIQLWCNNDPQLALFLVQELALKQAK